MSGGLTIIESIPERVVASRQGQNMPGVKDFASSLIIYPAC
jgi:hypothetical protein